MVMRDEGYSQPSKWPIVPLPSSLGPHRREGAAARCSTSGLKNKTMIGRANAETPQGSLGRDLFPLGRDLFPPHELAHRLGNSRLLLARDLHVACRQNPRAWSRYVVQVDRPVAEPALIVGNDLTCRTVRAFHHHRTMVVRLLRNYLAEVFPTSHARKGTIQVAIDLILRLRLRLLQLLLLCRPRLGCG